MENDKALKDLLVKGVPTAPDTFTAAVMNRIAAPLPAAPPLVSPRLKRTFLVIFFTFGLLACGLALSMGLPRVAIPAIDNDFLTGDIVQKAVTFLTIFWLLVAFNLLWERKVQPAIS